MSCCNIDNLTITLNQELNKIYNWLYANKLRLNVNTTQHCVFSPNNSNYEEKVVLKYTMKKLTRLASTKK